MLVAGSIRIDEPLPRRLAKAEIISWTWPTPADQMLLHQARARGFKNIQRPFNVTSARNVLLEHTIYDLTCEHTLTRGLLYALFAGKHSRDSTIANAMKVFIAVRRNSSAKVSFALRLVSTGDVEGDSPEQMLWADIFAPKRGEYASNHSLRRKRRKDRTEP